MNSAEIRHTFLEFFKSKNHHIVNSAPLVIKNDPTLMFVNSGMAPFKDIFLGNSPIQYARIADTQKCLRVSGKHNDLEEVGVDTYHHTLFEMLGNWSFGDYFKKDAIAWSWQLLTEIYKIPKDRIYVTVFEGSVEDNLSLDIEAQTEWEKHIDKNRILKGNKKDNFWEMGETGPCGPCSEIHVDIRDDADRKLIDGKTLVNNDHPHVIEIWNNVFMEFNRKEDGSLHQLPNKHVDTGMGFERLCMVLQGKKSNYDTDVFTPLLNKIEKLTNLSYTNSTNKPDVAFRVISDHVRAVSFTIADGQLPSNNGAGYVIRRILRRAIRYGYSFLNMREPFIYKLVQTLVEQMGEIFPEISNQKTFVETVIKEEEESFLRTLDKGISRINEIIENSKSISTIDGKQVFELYDTYGFPIDLTALIVLESGKNIDVVEFEKELEIQKQRSRAATTTSSGDWEILSGNNNSEFVGYDILETQLHVLKHRKVTVKNKQYFQLVFDKTPFYAEGGGQIGDTGYIESNGEKTNIVDTKKENNLFIHFCEKLPLNINSEFYATVNKPKRSATENNHTATHLLHHALRKILGNHVEQKGSLVNENALRFDFSHFTKLTELEISNIEELVNQEIRNNILLVEKRSVPINEAKQMGAMALFGEKYGESVRVIRFNESVELCGGTHVNSTGKIGLFKVISEGAVAAGIRRIEAVTGKVSEDYINDKLLQLKNASILLKNPKDISKSIESLLVENVRLSKEISIVQTEKVKNYKHELLKNFETINEIKFITKKLDLDSNAIKDLCFQLKTELENAVIIVACELNGKATIAVALSDDLIKNKNLSAINIIRDIATEINGSGGGQTFYAIAGGTKPEGIENAFSKAKNYLNQLS
jgi:alanyl-tRNA synthetase